MVGTVFLVFWYAELGALLDALVYRFKFMLNEYASACSYGNPFSILAVIHFWSIYPAVAKPLEPDGGSY